MKINLIARGKRNDITTLDAAAAERINQNFDQLFGDVRKIVEALKTYRVDLGSATDVIGTPTTFSLRAPTSDEGKE
jgi:hypothetical protein